MNTNLPTYKLVFIADDLHYQIVTPIGVKLPVRFITKPQAVEWIDSQLSDTHGWFNKSTDDA